MFQFFVLFLRIDNIFSSLFLQGIETDQTDLRRDTAFNLSLIYQSSGNTRMAQKMLYTYAVVWWGLCRCSWYPLGWPLHYAVLGKLVLSTALSAEGQRCGWCGVVALWTSASAICTVSRVEGNWPSWAHPWRAHKGLLLVHCSLNRFSLVYRLKQWQPRPCVICWGLSGGGECTVCSISTNYHWGCWRSRLHWWF